MPVTRVLAVEDDQTIRDLLIELLSAEGFEIQCAANGLEALAILGGWIPDVIILDLMMPVMDAEVFREHQLKMQRAANVPIIVLSALNDVQDRAKALGAVGVIAKPFDLDKLVKMLREMEPASAKAS
jgi:two-component system response regulator MprA